ncbi:MAG TPA: hypothetical protein VFX50_02665 [Gemmatimonadales bacterium]|nr:hypothetical protein [Gemmatimonadales bacterium]
MSSLSRRAGPRLALVLLATLAATPAAAQDWKKYENRVLATPALAGQSVPVLPLGSYSQDSSIAGDVVLTGWQTRRAATLAYDSLFALYLDDNAPDVRWVPPTQLARTAQRAPGMMTDPYRMGQAALRNLELTRVPDPLASRLRSLVAMTDARAVLVPANLAFFRDSAAVKAEVTAVLVDARVNEVKWRTIAIGRGRTPEAALRAAFATMVPPELNQ